jgi:predicted O-linked N-acetylglucosamine transferase (SPINDLY family)
LDEAAVRLRKVLSREPGLAHVHSNLLMSLSYASRVTSADIFAQAQEFDRQITPSGPVQDFNNNPDPHRRLRIGFVSGDFHAHPVGYFLARVLEALDPTCFEVFCYSNSAIVDAMTTRLWEAAIGWQSIVGVPDDKAAAMIRQDGIDILVDLSGHTSLNRLPLFALRPAPVQVTWLGYFGTTGLSTIDYIIADRFVVPPGEEIYFSETVWRLPGCYLCYSPHSLDIPTGPFPALANGFVTFGCFNNRAKLTAETVAAWAAILQQMDGSRLFLKTKSLTDAGCRAVLQTQFSDHGIAAERLILEGSSPLAEALEAYHRVDIALDPFPFGGCTTTAETLWMGVPLVALQGTRWTGRMSQSILATMNLNDWVATDVEGYVATACRLAGDLPNLAGLRSDLRRRLESSSFCDGPNFTRGLEKAYRSMWTEWCDGGRVRRK